MAVSDIIPRAQTTTALTQGGADISTSTETGAKEDIYDGDNSTYYEWYVHHGGDGNVTGWVNLDATWAADKTITKAYFYTQYKMTSGNYQVLTIKITTSLKIDGVWTVIDNLSQAGSPDFTTYTKTVTGPWEKVTGARLYMEGYAYSYEGDRNQRVWLRANELQAYYNVKSGYCGVV